MLPAALQPLNTYRQFIVYKLQPSSRPGKMDKMPVDWRTGNVADAHDPAIWTDYDTAYACGNGQVGFVFTDNDPFWFVDIDECLLPSGWSPLAQEICNLLPGAAIEVSVSGRGLHLFGTGQIPPHKTRGPSGSGIELYHTGRFVALGNPEGTTGNALQDCTAGITALVNRYFPKTAEELQEASWSLGPVEEWSGPLEDEQLISHACNAKSSGSVFGSKATFKDLWTGDAAALGKSYPDGAGRPYDESTADAALAQHLAFWTGKDCERMKRLMLSSALKRDKYDREDYLPRTILQAVAKQKEVCKYKSVEDNKLVVKARDVEGETYIHPDAQKLLFDGCVYVSDAHSILMPGGHMLNQSRFDAMCGGYSFVLDKSNTKTTKSAWEAFTQSQALRFPKVHAGEFVPSRPAADIWSRGNRIYVNTYSEISTPSKRGNPAPFLQHLQKILPNEHDRQIILAYMAAVVQYPGVKFKWAPLIQGAPGNGKTLLSRCVTEAVGREYCHTPKAKELSSRFNDWLEGRIFISVEDVFIGEHQSELAEALKPMLTDDWIEIEGKGGAKASRAVCANFILNSNHKDAVRKTRDDRRLAVFYCKQQTYEDIKRDGMAGSYFPDLYSWLKRDGYAIVTEYLQTYPIPAELNPAGDCHRAPTTSSFEEALMESAGRLEQEIQNAIENERIGFRCGWISSHFLDELIKQVGAERQYPPNKRRDLLKAMDYVPHPGLSNGQVNNAVSPDGCKPRLYVKENHPSFSKSGRVVADQYSSDQTQPSHLKAVAA